MADVTSYRVILTRLQQGSYQATNDRGGTVTMGASDQAFSPVELLLAAIGGCTAVDVDLVTGRRATPERFEVEVTAEKVRRLDGSRLRDIQVTFRLAFPTGEPGDAARAILPRAVATSHDRSCTVSRTVELGTAVAMAIEG